MTRHVRRAAIAVAVFGSLVCPSVSRADPDAEQAPPPVAPEPIPARRAAPEPPPAGASLQLDWRPHAGGRIPTHFAGLSIEWTLIERYMGPNARPAFANLLRSLGTGMLRIGGGSQDLVPFDPAATDNTNRVITLEDLASIRATLEAARAGDRPGRTPSWGVILGTAMAPPGPTRPWVGPDHARVFAMQGVANAFAGDGARAVAGIELGNEPDLTYASDPVRYLADFTAYTEAGAAGPFGIVAPNTSEPIAPWTSIEARSVPTRFFWDWPAILDVVAPAMHARIGPFGAFATDHFYPMARGCSTDEYRCATIPRLLSDERMQNFGYLTHTHASEAARRGLGYRVEELGSAAGRGVPGVSDVAASALWALDLMLNAACPQPPNAPEGNADCRIGATGINFHSAEARAFFRPEDGNAFYNAVNYDPTPAMGTPTASPQYYALLLFARFAHGTRGLRPVAVGSDQAEGVAVKAWRMRADRSERRLFLINKGDRAVTLAVSTAGRWYELHRLAPHDPAGAGRTLDAPAVRVDGREVAGDGSWPGFAPEVGHIVRRRFGITLGTGEAAVVRIHGRRSVRLPRG